MGGPLAKLLFIIKIIFFLKQDEAVGLDLLKTLKKLPMSLDILTVLILLLIIYYLPYFSAYNVPSYKVRTLIYSARFFYFQFKTICIVRTTVLRAHDMIASIVIYNFNHTSSCFIVFKLFCKSRVQMDLIPYHHRILLHLYLLIILFIFCFIRTCLIFEASTTKPIDRARVVSSDIFWSSI